MKSEAQKNKHKKHVAKQTSKLKRRLKEYEDIIEAQRYY